MTVHANCSIKLKFNWVQFKSLNLIQIYGIEFQFIFNWIQVQLKTNGMQIGIKDIENPVVTMVLNYFFKPTKHKSIIKKT